MSARWWSIWWSSVTASLLAASLVYWNLRLFVSAPGLPAGTVIAAWGPVVQGDLTRLLGADAPTPQAAAAAEAPPDARFQLIGVVTPRRTSAAREGLALIAVDGRPAKAYRVGAVVDGQTVLKAVAARGAQLGLRDGEALIQLRLADPPDAVKSR
jgi:general secretion pathway protein C